MMDAMWEWAKENYNLLSLLVGLVGVVIGVVSLVYELRKRKRDIASKITEKQAELDALDSIHYFPDSTTMGNTMIKRTTLQKEIEALKKKL